MATLASSILSIVLPKRRANEKGIGFTNTFNPQQTDQTLTLPTYREHLTDIFTTRTVNDSRELLRDLLIQDPDVSAAANAYLTTANTTPLFFVKDMEGNIDREGHKLLEQVILGLTTRSDYSKGFAHVPTLRTIAENMRYMVLLRGGIGAELVFDKTLIPREVRQIDLGTIRWFEESPGKYRPIQEPTNSSDEIDMNIPNFFVSYYRRDPTRIYTYSPFVAAVNTIAARQQVINDLYRIMQKTGYPRVEISVMEEVLRKNAPADIVEDENKMKTWLSARLQDIANTLNTMTPDQAFVHFDSVESNVLNKEGAGKSMDVTAIIDVLNAQNQAALKTMATVIGRGEMGTNTASTEARIFSLNAEELNHPVAEVFSQMFTLALRMQGHQGYVECRFEKVELRPDLELEPNRAIRQARLLELLSQGLITDDEFHIRTDNRIRPDEVPELSGTGFYNAGPEVDTDNISPNSDPLGRSIAPKGAKKASRSNVSK